MPRTVDHDCRKAELIEALIRVAAREGLHAVTMRSVAAEASVSLRLVQYYFGTKAELMHAALLHLERESLRRMEAQIAAMPDRSSARTFLDAFIAEALPTDCEGRRFQVLWMSFAMLAMTEPDLARQPFAEGPARLERQVTAVLRSAQETGELSRSRNPAFEATRLLALNHGLGTKVLVGQHAPDEAIEILSRHLDELFEAQSDARK